MQCEIALAQTRYPDDGDVVSMVYRMARDAALFHAKLVVFPEALMTRFENSLEDFWAAAEPLDGRFVTNVCDIAAHFGIWIVFTMNERNPDASDPRPFNTAVVADSAGQVRGVYRKAHLFDAQGFKESDRMAPGDALPQVIEGTPAGTLGLGICYDLRFPELARAQAEAGANLIVYPAAWVQGKDKIDQWLTLLSARAIESGCYVAGCGSVDPNRCGYSTAFNPYGRRIAHIPDPKQVGLTSFTLDTSLVKQARETFPTFQHRRPELY